MPAALLPWPAANALRKRWAALAPRLEAAGLPHSLAALHRLIPEVRQSNINRALQPLGSRPTAEAAAKMAAAMDAMQLALP
jgi:hypothetical protein